MFVLLYSCFVPVIAGIVWLLRLLGCSCSLFWNYTTLSYELKINYKKYKLLYMNYPCLLFYWLLSDCWVIHEWFLSDCWVIHEWWRHWFASVILKLLLSDYRVIAEWLLSNGAIGHLHWTPLASDSAPLASPTWVQRSALNDDNGEIGNNNVNFGILVAKMSEITSLRNRRSPIVPL